MIDFIASQSTVRSATLSAVSAAHLDPVLMQSPSCRMPDRGEHVNAASIVKRFLRPSGYYCRICHN